jgi:hypoxanthine phosphoribosyltransferase
VTANRPQTKRAPARGAAPRAKKKTTRSTAAAKKSPARAATSKRILRKPARPKRPPAEQPLGAGVGDAFAVRRLMKTAPTASRSRSGVREIGWAEFGVVAAELADRIAQRYRPDVVLGIANAGVFVGGALAPALHAELVHLHLPGRGGDSERLPSLAGQRVLVVDDAAHSGRTLARASAMAKKAGAAEVRTAVIVLRPGGARPDWHAIATADVTVFGWDYQFHAGPGDGGSDPGDTGV